MRCQAEHLRKSVRLLANDCSQSRASAVRAALDDLFASVEELSESALAEQLDCSDARPFWKAGAANSSTTRDGFFFINWSCRQACKVKEWAADGRRTVRDCVEIKILRRVLLNHRVDLHAIDACTRHTG